MKKIMNLLSVGCLLWFLTISFDTYAQPPENDECDRAEDISALFDGACNVSNLSMVIDNTGATGNATDPPEPGEAPICPQTDDTNLFGDPSNTMEVSIWFTFTVPDLNGDGSPVEYSLWTSVGQYGDCGLNPNNILGLDSAPDIGDTQIAIYESDTCPDNTLGECDYFAANEDLFTVPPWISGWLSLSFVPGQTYYLLIDTWDGAMGEFCLSVTPCGTLCGDGACAPVETYCECVDCQTECPFGNIAGIRYDEDDPDTPDDESGFFFSDDLSGNIFFCSEFAVASSNDNIYLGFGGTNWTNCDGTVSNDGNGGGVGIDVSLSVGQFAGGAIDNGDGTFNIPTGALLYIELTPADIMAGSITITVSVPDGIGNTCEETITINFADFPQSSDPYCELTCLAGDIDPNLVDQTVCEDGNIQLCTDGLEDLSLTCNSDDGSSFVFAWRVMGLVYGSEFDLTDFIVQASSCETIPVADIMIDQFGYVPPDFTPGAPLPPGTYTVVGAALCINADGSIVEGCLTPTIMNVTIQAAGTCGAPGCTDPCADNYDPDATEDDGSCNPQLLGCTDATACNYDATALCDDGSCDPGNPDCADPCNPVMGCTDAAACNYDAAACVDDGSCDPGNPDCADPCNPEAGCTNPAACNFNPDACVDDATCDLPDGCTDATACNYDPAALCDDGSCDFGNPSCPDPCNEVTGCTDGTACNFNPDACVDDGSCDFGDPSCPIDPCNPVGGCLNNPDACNFNPDACFDDGSCQAPPCNPGCTDECAPNYDPNADEDDGSCEPYDMTCNTDCTLGDIEIWNPIFCACDVDIPTVLGCTDDTACNYDPAANCDDGTSCDFGDASCAADPCNPIPGCTDDTACNYNPDACIDDGSCLAPPCNPGCTDPCADNYDPDAEEDDGTCNPYDMTCNADCTAGPFGGTWDPVACECADETEPVNGCTDATADNYDPAANCDDGTCVIDPGCIAEPATIEGGPFDFCADDGTPDFVTGITVDGGAGTNAAWVITDDLFNILALPGMPGEVDFDGAGFGTCLIWYLTFEDDLAGADVGANAGDLTGCYALSNPITVLRNDCEPSCTAEPATISGGPFEFCANDGTPDFVSGITVDGGVGANTAWVITDDQLNILGLPGMPGEVDFDGAGFGTCLIWYVTFEDLAGAEVGANAGDLTGCFALSNSIEVDRIECLPCEDEISGTIATELACDVSGTAVLITDADGVPFGMAIVDPDGNYVLPGGPYPCGEYIATLDAASIPACYTEAGGDVGPSGFVVDGDGEDDGANFSSFEEVPTLSQWGLMVLALLLMSFGAIKLGFVGVSAARRKI